MFSFYLKSFQGKEYVAGCTKNDSFFVGPATYEAWSVSNHLLRGPFFCRSWWYTCKLGDCLRFITIFTRNGLHTWLKRRKNMLRMSFMSHVWPIGIVEILSRWISAVSFASVLCNTPGVGNFFEPIFWVPGVWSLHIWSNHIGRISCDIQTFLLQKQIMSTSY